MAVLLGSTKKTLQEEAELMYKRNLANYFLVEKLMKQHKNNPKVLNALEMAQMGFADAEAYLQELKK